MKLFQHTSGMVIAFGFDMLGRVRNGSMIGWSDRDGKSWDALPSNEAGSAAFASTIVDGIDPEFVFEANGTVLAYQPGLCIEMKMIGPPFTWSISFLRPNFKTPAVA